MPKIQIHDLLIKINFNYSRNIYSIKFENLELNAGVCYDYKGDYFYFFGSYISERMFGEIDFKLPTEVDSYEQGIAFLAYYLRKYDFVNSPAWLILGESLSGLLPWEIERAKYLEERAKYLASPNLQIEAFWFKTIVKQLKMQSEKANEKDIFRISFDGEVLKIHANEFLTVAPAIGKAWDQNYNILVKSVEFLPRRFSTNNIYTIRYWNDYLEFDNRKISVCKD